MSTTRKKQIFKAMKFRIIKNAKFYSIKIKWVYSSQYHVLLFNSTEGLILSFLMYTI